VLRLGLLGLAGAGLIAGSTGQVGLAVGASPAALRTTGVGWGAALGRIGSILGPVASGLLLVAGTPSRGVIAVLAAPLVVAGAPALASRGDPLLPWTAHSLPFHARRPRRPAPSLRRRRPPDPHPALDEETP
jgi:MFS family permease